MTRDFRLALRRMLHSPLLSVSVIVILGTGVAAAATMASVWNALALRTVNVPDPESLVAIISYDKRLLPRNTPLPAIDRLRAAELAADGWCGFNTTLDATESGARVLESYGELMAGDCETVIGIRPAVGRWFTSDEAPLTGPGKPVMIITDRYWTKMFDRRLNVLGRTVKIQNVTVTVIGVMPPRYTGLNQDLQADFILPFNAHRPSSGANMMLGRLKPGATVQTLSAQARTLWPALLESVLPDSPTRAQTLAETTGGAEGFAGGTSTLRRLYTAPVQRLSALAGLLLLLVCVNVGGLMVSRIASRASEITAMRALGASHWRIARQLIAESAIFATAGALLGVLLTFTASGAFTMLLPTGNLPWTIDTTPDPLVIAVVAMGIVVMTFVIAALPIWLAIQTKAQLRTDRTVAHAIGGWAKALLVAQVAVTVVLVFTAGLIGQSFNVLRTVARGYDREHLLSLRLSANPGGYQGMDAGVYYRTLIERVRSLPGVRSVGLARYFGTINSSPFNSAVGLADSTENLTDGMIEYVSPGFFATAGVPFLSGRDVQWIETAAAPKVAVVSESLASVLSAGGDVIGRVIRYGTAPATARLQIVGVVGNLSMGNVRQNDLRMVYVSSVQFNETAFATVHVKTEGPPLQLASAATNAIASLGREHVRGAYAHDVLFTNSIVAERMSTIVSGAGAGLALIVSSIGLFAMLAHSVERRTREIGIRVAIGATPGMVSGAVVRDALWLVALGLAIGLPAAVGSAGFARSLLYEVSTSDFTTVVSCAVLLIGIAIVAALVPAVRAVRVDPSQALRAE